MSLFKYDYKFEKIKKLLVYHDGPLTIYIYANQLYWNRNGKLSKVDSKEVERYFELH